MLMLTLMQLLAAYFACFEFVAVSAYKFGAAARPTHGHVRAIVFPLVIAVALILVALEVRVRKRLLNYYTILFVAGALAVSFYIIFSAPFMRLGGQ